MKRKFRLILTVCVISTLLVIPAAAQVSTVFSSNEAPPVTGIPEYVDAVPGNVVVTTTADNTTADGLCSLREAVQAATTNSTVDACAAGDGTSTDTIAFSVSGTITLTSYLDVSTGGPLVIDGGGVITVSGGGSARPFYADHNANVTLKNLTITDGYAWQGGCIHNTGALTLQDSSVSGCITYDNLAGGGGIYNNGTLTILNSTISGNHALSSGTDVSYGGGIYNFTGSVSLTNSTISANDADLGGGILSFGTLIITNSTLSGNSAWQEGGGIYSTGTLYVASATLTGNSAGDYGGGIYAGNHPFYLRNTILAKNIANIDGPECYAETVGSSGYNLVGNTQACGIYPRMGDLTSVDPQLGPLQDNDGQTLTHALLPNSLGVNQGNLYGCSDFQGSPLTTDQRGYPRSGRCDIGAYELQAPTAAGPYNIYLPCVSSACANPLFFDDFSVPGNDWPIFDDNARRYEYINQEYRILAKVVPAWIGALPSFKAAQYVLEVDARSATGASGYHGILFSFAQDWSHFYFFVVNPDGRYVILRNDPNTSYWIADGYSGSIHTGTATNHLKLERNGSMIWAYANGDLLTILSDGTFTGVGYVGLITVADTTPNIDARFDNFTVLPITCGRSYSYPALAADSVRPETMELAPPDSWVEIPRTWTGK